MENNISTQTTADRICLVLEACNIKKIELSKTLKISSAAVSSLCNGKNNPSKQTVELICKNYNVNEKWLTTGEGEMFSPLTKEQEISQIVKRLYGEEPDSWTLKLASLLCKMSEEQMRIFRDALRVVSETLDITEV